MSITVRIGLPKTTGALPGAAFDLEAPVLVSANSLWDDKRKRFREPGSAITDLDVALDSAGFVAMHLYGGYRWTVEQYVELAGLWGWTWWSAMDLACEPELAGDQAAINDRIWGTAYNLAYCRKVARTWREAGADWLTDPMPIVQGWTADDYERCVDLFDDVLDGEWPEMIGVGSVCRRHLHGPAGLLTILGRLDAVLPPHVKLHLFGVKSQALAALANHPRVVSVDSLAWDEGARRDARQRGASNTIANKRRHMADWYAKQSPAVNPPQLSLL